MAVPVSILNDVYHIKQDRKPAMSPQRAFWNKTCARPVIASEAKQSMVPREERMDCFASLAMTIAGLSAG
jgi:hypothetical protein